MFQNKNLLLMMYLFIKNGNCDNNCKKYPYVVGVGYVDTAQNETETNICSGSLIDKTWVITAGSCLQKYGKREQFVCIDENCNRDLSVSKVKVLSRQFFSSAKPDEESYGAIMSPTFLGMLKIETLAIKTLPKLSSDDYRVRFGLQVVYAVFRKDFKTDKVHIIEFVICPCLAMFKAFICVQDPDNALSTFYGAPLIHDDTIIGIYAGSVENNKLFVPVNELLDEIRERIAEEEQPTVNTKLTIRLYYNNSHSKL